MGSPDETIEINILERCLLSGSTSNEYADADDDTVLYGASFEEMEDNYVKYQMAMWILYSLLLILAWGIGIFMLLYPPIRRHVLRKDFRSRKIYVTTNAIIYKVTRPVFQTTHQNSPLVHDSPQIVHMPPPRDMMLQTLGEVQSSGKMPFCKTSPQGKLYKVHQLCFDQLMLAS